MVSEYKNVKCKHCGYGWETKSGLKMITCPSCQLKTVNEEGSEE